MYQSRVFSSLTEFFAQFSEKENRQISAEAVYFRSTHTRRTGCIISLVKAIVKVAGIIKSMALGIMQNN